MKYWITALFLTVSTISFGQAIETGKLWRTKGVYDSLGKFLEWNKVLYFLYSADSNTFYSLEIEHILKKKIAGDSRFYISEIITIEDTLYLTALEGKKHKFGNRGVMTIHSEDSLTISYGRENVYSYVKLNYEVDSVMADETFIQSFEGANKYRITYQDNKDFEAIINYEIINFNGFIFLQERSEYITKLITKVKEGEAHFIEIDYRFENKEGKLTKIK